MPAEARFYRSLPENTVQCNLCHRFCKIRDGRPGLCRVRINRGGKLFTLNYGYPVTIARDPVEKKPLYHFLPGSSTLSAGTFGCNFRCGNCQNWEISQSSGEGMKLPFRSPGSIVQEALDTGCPSISCTYNEPTVFAEFALDIMTEARSAGLKSIWVSNGYMSANCLDAAEPLLDAANIDLKSMDDSFYRKICGCLLQPVLDNLKRLARSSVHLEITTLLIPGYSDSPEMLERLAEFITEELGPGIPWHVSAFVPEISWKMRDTPHTATALLDQAYAIGKQAGLLYVYASGNLENTCCPRCGNVVVERIRYSVIPHDRGGCCPGCAMPVVTIS